MCGALRVALYFDRLYIGYEARRLIGHRAGIPRRSFAATRQ